MNLQKLLEYHENFKAQLKIEPIYTGSVALLLEGYIDRLPNDIDIAIDEVAFSILKQDSFDVPPYDDEEEKYSFAFLGIKTDVFLNKNYEVKKTDVLGKTFYIIPSSVAIDKKIGFLEKSLSSFKKGEFVTDKYRKSLIKHLNDICMYNSRLVKPQNNTIKKSDLPF